MGNPIEEGTAESVPETRENNTKPVVGLAKDFVREPDPVRELALALYDAGVEHLGKSKAIAEILITAGYTKTETASDATIREARASELDNFGSFLKLSVGKPLYDRFTLRRMATEISRRAAALKKGDQ